MQSYPADEVDKEDLNSTHRRFPILSVCRYRDRVAGRDGVTEGTAQSPNNPILRQGELWVMPAAVPQIWSV